MVEFKLRKIMVTTFYRVKGQGSVAYFEQLGVAKVISYQWARKKILPNYRLEGTIGFKLEDVKVFC